LIDLKQYEVWFLTGTQPLYDPKPLETVTEHSRGIAAALGVFASMLVRIVFKPVLTRPDAIRDLVSRGIPRKTALER
jgi:L-arabinose isomerase